MDPVKAIINFYNDNYSIQEMVNSLLIGDVYGYNENRIRNLLLIYKRLCSSGQYEYPADVELEETQGDFSNGHYKCCQVTIKPMSDFVNAINAIIIWYEKGVSISNMIDSLEEALIDGYDAKRIQKIIRIYKRLKKENRYNKVADIELEQDFLEVPETEKPDVKSTEKLAEDSDAQTPVENLPEDPLPVFNELQNHVTMVAQGLTAAD